MYSLLPSPIALKGPASFKVHPYVGDIAICHQISTFLPMVFEMNPHSWETGNVGSDLTLPPGPSLAPPLIFVKQLLLGRARTYVEKHF